MLGMDKKNFWEMPPAWAKPIDQNSETLTQEERRAMRNIELIGYVPAQAPTERERRGPRRRVGRSSIFG